MKGLILIVLGIFVSACAASPPTKAEDNQAEFYNDRGVAHAQGKGQYDQAISDFTSAIEINPEYAEAYYNRGVVHAQGKGQYDQAISDFTNAL